MYLHAEPNIMETKVVKPPPVVDSKATLTVLQKYLENTIFTKALKFLHNLLTNKNIVRNSL